MAEAAPGAQGKLGRFIPPGPRLTDGNGRPTAKSGVLSRRDYESLRILYYPLPEGTHSAATPDRDLVRPAPREMPGPER